MPLYRMIEKVNPTVLQLVLNCPKCNLRPRIRQDHLAYYAHCICGHITTLVSKIEDTEDVNPQTYPKLFKEFERGKPRRSQNPNSIAHFLTETLLIQNCQTTGELLQIALDSNKFKVLDSSYISTTLTQLQYHSIVHRIDNRKGQLGGSTWETGAFAHHYVGNVPLNCP